MPWCSVGQKVILETLFVCRLLRASVAYVDVMYVMMMMSWSLTTHQPFWVISVIKVRFREVLLNIKTIIDKLKY